MYYVIHKPTLQASGPYSNLEEVVNTLPEVFRYGYSEWVVVKVL